jgi:hypothetical protein
LGFEALSLSLVVFAHGLAKVRELDGAKLGIGHLLVHEAHQVDEHPVGNAQVEECLDYA